MVNSIARDTRIVKGNIYTPQLNNDLLYVLINNMVDFLWTTEYNINVISI